MNTIYRQDFMPSSRTFVPMLMMAACWSPSYIFIKLAVAELEPVWLVFFRLWAGFLISFIILKMRGQKFNLRAIQRRHWMSGLLACALPYCLFAIAGRYVDTALSAILNGTTPIFTVLLAHLFLEDEKLTKGKMIGVMLGIIGFAIIILPTILDMKIDGDTYAIAGLGLASMCYGTGMVFSRKHFGEKTSFLDPVLQLFCAALLITPVNFLFFSPMPNFLELKTKTLLCALGLSFFGTSLASFMYFRINRLYGATVLGLSTFLLPVFGSILGIIFLDERLSFYTLVGGIFILLGLRLTAKK